METVTFEIDEDLKKEAEKICREQYGISFEKACELFIKECVQNEGFLENLYLKFTHGE